VIDEAEHLVTLFEPSTQRVDPAVPGVVNPLRVRNESASVFITTSLSIFGLKLADPEALNC
jgi:hypothetical protein